MSRLMRFELIRWTRSRRLLALAVVFGFSALSAPLLTAYAEALVGSLQTANNLKISVSSATWRDGVLAYVNNAAQLALLFACYLSAWATALGPNQHVRTFYNVRAISTARLYLMRVVTVALLIGMVAICSGFLALLMILSLFDDVNVVSSVGLITLQTFGFVMACVLCSVFAALTNAPIVSSLVTYFALLLLDMFRDSSWTGGFLPTALIRPELIGDEVLLVSSIRPLIAAAVVLSIAICILVRKPIRYGPEGIHRSMRSPKGRPVPSIDSRGTRMQEPMIDQN